MNTSILIRIFAILWISAISFCAGAVEATPHSPITISKINDNLYVFTPEKGRGSNVGVVLSKDGVLLIDAMNRKEDNPKLLSAALKSITDLPVKFIINTHNHGDHTGTNQYFVKRGATVISQRNVLREKENSEHPLTYNNQWFVNRQLIMNFGGQRIEASGAIAHTYNDLIVYLPQSNVVFMGDVFGTNWGPNSSQQADGVLAQVLANIDNNTKVVPGHGFVTDKAHLAQYRTNSSLWLNTIYQSAANGETAESILATPTISELVSFFSGGNKEGGYSDPNNLKRRIQRTMNAKPTKDFVIKDITLYLGQHQLSDNQTITVFEQAGFYYAAIEGQFVARLRPASPQRFNFSGWPNGQHLIFKLQDNKVTDVELVVPPVQE